MKIDVVIEKRKKEFWGRIEGYEFLPVTVGKNINNVLENLKMLIADYIENEGQKDKRWKNVDVNKIGFNLHGYDMNKKLFDKLKESMEQALQHAEGERSDLRQTVLMEYKGYKGRGAFSEDDGVFVGRVLDVEAIIMFEGNTVEELVKGFHESIDFHLEIREKRHEQRKKNKT